MSNFKTPNKNLGIKPGHVIVSNKWKNNSLVAGLKGYFMGIKFTDLSFFDFCLPTTNIVYLSEQDLIAGVNRESLHEIPSALFIADRNIVTIDIYSELQKILFDLGKSLIPVGHSGEIPLILQQLNLADSVHSPGSTFRATIKAPPDVQIQLLLNIPGLGKSKAVKLLKVYGSVQKIAFASREDLSRTVGTSTADQVYRYFHDLVNT